jgi:methylenetetrahydrofolate dehydrogenase (NADP+)/methenyltetrahydrofolate cyclohydrolase
MATLIKSKPLIDSSLPQLAHEVEKLKTKPRMRVILVGDNPASLAYVGHKEKMCKKIGAEFDLVKLDTNITREQFLAEIKKLNEDSSIHGGFVQLPLPEHLKDIDTTELINNKKDVDGFGIESFMGLIKDDYKRAFIPCTPKGILKLLKHFEIPIKSQNITIIGRSLIVGKPLFLLLQAEGATVTLCHSKTKDLKEHTKSADIIISAVGKKRFLTEEYFKNDQSQVLIDVGINKDSNGKLCGDMDLNNIQNQVKAITPVPGGVGPMTVFSLMENLILATQRQEGN